MLQHVDFLCKFSVTFLALVFLNPFVKLHVVTKGMFCLHSCETQGTGHLIHHSHLQGRTQAHVVNQQLCLIFAASPQLHIFDCLCSNAHYHYNFNSRKKALENIWVITDREAKQQGQAKIKHPQKCQLYYCLKYQLGSVQVITREIKKVKVTLIFKALIERNYSIS